MIEVMTLSELTIEHLRLANSFISQEVYSVERVETETEFGITLHRRELTEPYEKRWPVSEQLLADHNRVLEQGLSSGAFDDGDLVGFAIAEREDWNGSLMVREFRVADSHRRQGIGRRLMDRVASHARRQGFRTVVHAFEYERPGDRFLSQHRFRIRRRGPDFLYERRRPCRRSGGLHEAQAGIATSVMLNALRGSVHFGPVGRKSRLGPALVGPPVLPSIAERIPAALNHLHQSYGRVPD